MFFVSRSRNALIRHCHCSRAKRAVAWWLDCALENASFPTCTGGEGEMKVSSLHGGWPIV